MSLVPLAVCVQVRGLLCSYRHRRSDGRLECRTIVMGCCLISGKASRLSEWGSSVVTDDDRTLSSVVVRSCSFDRVQTLLWLEDPPVSMFYTCLITSIIYLSQYLYLFTSLQMWNKHDFVPYFVKCKEQKEEEERFSLGIIINYSSSWTIVKSGKYSMNWQL